MVATREWIIHCIYATLMCFESGVGALCFSNISCLKFILLKNHTIIVIVLKFVWQFYLSHKIFQRKKKLHFCLGILFPTFLTFFSESSPYRSVYKPNKRNFTIDNCVKIRLAQTISSTLKVIGLLASKVIVSTINYT